MSSALPSDMAWERSERWLGGAALVLLALLAVGPLLLDQPPVDWIEPSALALGRWGSAAVVVMGMLAAVGLRAALDRKTESRPVWLHLVWIVLAGLMTGCHWYMVDRQEGPANWQRLKY